MSQMQCLIKREYHPNRLRREQEAAHEPSKNVDCRMINYTLVHLQKFREQCMPRIILQIDRKYTDELIEKLMTTSPVTFLYDLKYGTTEENDNFLTRLNSITKLYYEKTISKPLTIETLTVLGINGRQPKIGHLEDDEVILKMKRKFILTADRRMAMCGCRVAAYANCYDYLEQTNLGDIIRVGEQIQLFVVKIIRQSFVCVVKKGGRLECGQKVVFPCCPCIDDYTVSKEERDDIEFALKYNYDIIMVPETRHVEYARSLRQVVDLKGKYVMLMAVASPNDVCRDDDAICMSEAYCGIALTTIDEELDDRSKKIIEAFNKLKKPVILLVDQAYPGVTLTEPYTKYSSYLQRNTDVYWLRNWTIASMKTFKINHSIELDLLNYRTIEFKHLTSDTKTILNSIANKSWDLAFTAIFMISRSGSTIQALSTFRPICPIIAMVKNQFLSKQLQLYRNVYPILYDDLEMDQISTSWLAKRNHILFKGILVARTMNLVRDGDPILFLVRAKRGLSCFNVIKMVRLLPLELEAFFRGN